jgi:redox-sensitive bicupin YhaK (pirin superfamily)
LSIGIAALLTFNNNNNKLEMFPSTGASDRNKALVLVSIGVMLLGIAVKGIFGTSTTTATIVEANNLTGMTTTTNHHQQQQQCTTPSTTNTDTTNNNNDQSLSPSRNVDKIVLSKWQREGMGAMVRRSIGGAQLRQFNPFLMLDEFNAGLPAAFPDHFHRGIQTVSFVLPDSEGSFQHEDSRGNKGHLHAGGLQWLNAGRGIVHSEVPLDEKKAHGLQLWVNLRRKDKMSEPSYQDLTWEQIPHGKTHGVDVAVISGESLGVASPVRTLQPVHYLYVTMEPNSVFIQPIDPSWNAFCYILRGSAKFGEKQPVIVEAQNTVTFDRKGKSIKVETLNKEGAIFVMLSGEPTPADEPIIQYGPVVMNSQEEIQQAFEDYRLGRNGFEGSTEWESEIAKKLFKDFQ